MRSNSKTKMKNTLFTILTFLICASSAIAQVEFSAQARNAVLVGEKFQLVYSLNEEGSDLMLAPLNDFNVLMGPSVTSSSSTQIMNGKVTRSKQYTYTYILKGTKPGKYTIQPAKITVDGKKYTSNAVTIEVVKDEGARQKQEQQNGGQSSNGFSKDDLFIRVAYNKSSIYQGEPLVLTTKIYTRINLDNISDIKHPDFRNFIVQDIEKSGNIEWNYETINNKQYNVGVLEQKVLYAQRTGEQVIDPMEIEFLIKQRVNRRSTSIFDDFFNESYRTIKKRVKSKPIKVNVKPYPSGKPANFNGTVGKFNMKVTTSQNQVKVDDGITIKVEVSGTGNHKLMSAPKLKVPTDFDSFDATVSNNLRNTVSGMKGSKTYEYLIIPRFGGTFTIDPIEFTYFDPSAKSYKTITSKPIVIEVEKGESNGSNNNNGGYVPGSVNREDVKFVGKDIRYIKTGKTVLKPVGTFIFGSTPFILGYIIPILLLIIALLLNRKRMHENANVHLVKNKQANKMATKRLKKASAYLKEGNNEAFYDEILKANYAYLSDKLFLPVSELSKDKAATLLSEKGVKTETIGELTEVLDTCEFARFSPSAGESQEMDKLYKKAISTISNIDDQVKK